MMMDVEPPEPHHSGHRWVDISVAVCALIVSVISLGLAMVHGHTMERMAEANARLVEANSWPHLEAYTSNLSGEGKPQISITVVNSGVGPAKIHSAEVLYDGRPIRSWPQFLQACCGGVPAGGDYTSSTRATHGVLRAGESVDILTVSGEGPNAPLWTALNRERARLSYRICYCSVFEDCWLTDGRSLEPKSVKQCPADPSAA